jgi:hypothetical protein
MDVQGPPGILERPPSAKLLNGGDDVHRLALGVEPRESLEDEAVGPPVEILGADPDVGHRGDGLAGEHHRAEDGLLGFQVVGRDPFRPEGADLVSALCHRPPPS